MMDGLKFEELNQEQMISFLSKSLDLAEFSEYTMIDMNNIQAFIDQPCFGEEEYSLMDRFGRNDKKYLFIGNTYYRNKEEYEEERESFEEVDLIILGRAKIFPGLKRILYWKKDEFAELWHLTRISYEQYEQKLEEYRNKIDFALRAMRAT